MSEPSYREYADAYYSFTQNRELEDVFGPGRRYPLMEHDRDDLCLAFLLPRGEPPKDFFRCLLWRSLGYLRSRLS